MEEADGRRMDADKLLAYIPRLKALVGIYRLVCAVKLPGWFEQSVSSFQFMKAN